ncbi:hypothetical protein D9758_007298 [Tetrapyrgos nigripes]|uniref:Uncharacterized protein n=1 Tax=Tetrapyrgos nigripes TaxID=182062 RepID=A0A8H5LLM5_9AGAR|nr:hypothetical protein D9758_007298 [Tetrapyrgos nigripes]
MAVLAPSDWQIHNMDLNGRQQRSSPANDSNAPSAPSSNGHHHQPSNSHQQQQPPPQSYPYPVQQQPQGSWTPSITAQPFYPSFYPNQQPQPYPQLPQQTPYFDPANAQLAQWAYQQMMFAQQGFHPPQQPQRPSPSGRTPQNTSPNEYFVPQNQMNMYNPFPSGTPPPPHPHRTPSVDQQQPPNAGPYPGYHPYRRPTRPQAGQSQSHSPSPPQSDNSDWRPGGVVSPPYARPDASGSSSSVNSAGSGRPRTDSNQSARSNRGHDTPPNSSVRSRNGSGASAPPPASGGSSNRSSPSGSTSSAPRIPHHRNLSSSSNSSSGSRPSGLSPSPPTTSTSTSSANTSSPIPRPARPSPLSQGTFTASEKRMSRDDSDLHAMLESTSGGTAGGRSGLKGRLRRALTFNAAQAALKEEDDDASIKASNLGSSSKLKAKTPALISSATSKSSTNGSSDIRSPESMADDAESTATIQTTTTKKRGRAASLFNSRLNASTDNISLSSTVSSASVMIRKLGSMGKLARRNSLAGITSLFKDKKNKDKEDEEGGEGSVSGKKKKDKKGAKAEASEASVSHVTAELDRSSDWGGPEMSGLSPAAKLARQHTLKTNAEAAAIAKAKAQQEAAAAAATADAAAGASKTFPNGNSAGVPTWEKNTTTRQGSVSPVKGGGGVRVNEDGTRVVVEDEDEDDRSDDDHYAGPPQGDSIHAGWDDDDDWDGEDDEDVTIRLGVEKVNMEDEVVYEEPDPWAVDVRRSVERTRQPTKGILKNADKYDQTVYLAENAGASRVRSNSYNSHPNQAEAGPLARMPSPDPDHIDGLHRHGSHSSGHHGSPTAPSLPSFSFESSPTTRSSFDAPRDSSDTASTVSHPMFTHPNSSAPVLSTVSASAPTLTHRSATTPSNSKRLAFANNLSVYDTFSANVYDRRSEPATWSRLTPALAQRIKEELNSYKMEEMEVHASSRLQ